MTDERMALLELVEQSADADLVREMLAFAAERIMEAEVELVTGAATGAAFRVAVTRWATTTAPLHELLAEALDLIAAGLADPPRKS